jgi:uncharacterized protein YqkB
MNVVFKGVAGVAGSYFFDNNMGMAGFRPIADNIVLEVFGEYIAKQMNIVIGNRSRVAAVASIS